MEEVIAIHAQRFRRPQIGVGEWVALSGQETTLAEEAESRNDWLSVDPQIVYRFWMCGYAGYSRGEVFGSIKAKTTSSNSADHPKTLVMKLSLLSNFFFE